MTAATPDRYASDLANIQEFAKRAYDEQDLIARCLNDDYRDEALQNRLTLLHSDESVGGGLPQGKTWMKLDELRPGVGLGTLETLHQIALRSATNMGCGGDKHLLNNALEVHGRLYSAALNVFEHSGNEMPDDFMGEWSSIFGVLIREFGLYLPVGKHVMDGVDANGQLVGVGEAVVKTNVQGGEDHPNGDYPFDDVELEILKALENATTLQSQYDLASTTKIGRKTIGTRLGKLRKAGFTERPKGDKNGERITDMGREALRKHDAKMTP